MSYTVKKFFCPRLIDYIIVVGPQAVDSPADQTTDPVGYNRIPHLLRRYPIEDHKDFALPPDVVIFCQPEGCDRVESSLNSYNNPSQTTNSFVFSLTEKDTSRVRYGICLNFYRPLQKYPHKQHNQPEPIVSHENDHDILSEASTVTKGTAKHPDSITGEHGSMRTDNDSGIKIFTGPDCDSVGGSSLVTSASNISSQYINGQSGSPTNGEQQPKSNIYQRNYNEHNHHPHQSHQHHHHHHHHYHRTRPGTNEKSKITYALTSICIVSHHPFFSTFRECLLVMKKYIQACEDRNYNIAPGKCKCHVRNNIRVRRNSQVSQASRRSLPSMHRINCPYSCPVWSLLTMPDIDEAATSPSTIADVAEIESWILRLLSVPVPVPGKTKIELEVLPTSLRLPLSFALPDHTRFSLIDFPIHLPFELLGVQTCLQVLTCILLEHKVILQSKDYNALSMSVMAFVTMIYPLEYMFPVIPLLPSCMSSAEQLLLAPTPFVIGLPSSFFKFKANFILPNDVWVVDLDSNKVRKPANADFLPPLPDHEGSILIQNLQKILNSMSDPTDSGLLKSNPISSTPTHQDNHPSSLGVVINDGYSASATSSPFKRRTSMAAAGQLLQFAANKLSGSTANINTRNYSPSSSTRSSIVPNPVASFDPLAIINGDPEAVDVAVRIAMVRFFNSTELLANFVEHTRTIRLYPRPVVSFQKSSFIQSRLNPSPFLIKLVDTQAVEYMAEWALCPDNVAFQRIQTGLYDPKTIGDKPKWYCQQLDSLKYQVWTEGCKDFYEEICIMIKDGSHVSGAASSTGKFSDYYDDGLEKAIGNTQSDLEEEDQAATASTEHQGLSLPVLDTKTLEDDAHSTYISSNDSSPCCDSDKDEDEGINTPNGQPLTLNDVLNLRLRKSSISSSTTSIGSWDGNNQTLQSIPANYLHGQDRYPPLRANIRENFKPATTLVYSTREDEVKVKELDQVASSTIKHQESIESSEDDNDSSKLPPDSSSCDESGTEEFDFASLDPIGSDARINADTREAAKMFESVDSDTIVPSNPTDQSVDMNNNVVNSESKTTLLGESFDNMSLTSSAEPVSQSALVEQQIASKEIQMTAETSSLTDLSQKRRKVASGLTKLIDTTASLEKRLSLNQSGEPNSPLPGGEQVGAFIGRFTSEARDAVKEAKNVLKSTALPAADASRQKILKNIHTFGEAFFEERRNSKASFESGDQTSRQLGANNESNPTKVADLNNITDKASALGGWLGSKASGLANKMRDKTRPLGPFPTSKFRPRLTHIIL